MKRLLSLLSCAALLAGATAARADRPAPAADAGRGPRFGFELRAGGVAFDKDCWDDSVGGGFDAGLVFWEPSGTFGLWAGIGAQGATYLWEDDWSEVESDIVAVPFGASLLARIELGACLALRGEVGARYVAMDVDDDWDDDHRHRRRYSDRDRYLHPDRYLDVDDTSLAVAALQLEFDFDPIRLAVGGGYQFDLEKPDMKYLGRPIGEVDLSGAIFFVSFGVVF